LRVISLVPSLTETLIDCGVNVVGRTRFCIHPDEAVTSIPVVGGTKDVNWALCEPLRPDLVVMDKEENTLPMAESCPFKLHATHITSVDAIGDEIIGLSRVLESQWLRALGSEWQELARAPDLVFRGFDQIPAILWPIGSAKSRFKRIEYMIWRNPWMAVGQQTFIGSVLKKVGLAEFLPDYEKPYPELDATTLPDPDTYYLFSSEPYPFGRHVDALSQAGFNGALVDGEFYSWFGSRSFRLLRQYMEMEK